MEKLIIKTKSGIHAMPFDDIMYMEKELRKIKVHFREAKVDFYGKFIDVMPRLDSRFMWCHRSYIINMDKIVVMADNTIYIENNDRIYMGRNSYCRAKKIFGEYISKKFSRNAV